MGDVIALRTLTWTPHPKDRPRLGKHGGFYTPAATKKAEALLRSQWDLECYEGPLDVKLYLTDENVKITIREAKDPKSTMKGDLDNLGKLVLDALNGVAWVDDRQIVRLEIVKR